MPSDDLRKRIEALNRKPLKNVPELEPEGSTESPEIRGLRRKLRKQGEGFVPGANSRNTATGYAHRNQPEPISYSRTVPASPPASPAQASAARDFGLEIALEAAVRGVVAEATSGPGFYLVEQPAHELDGCAAETFVRFSSLTGHPDGEAVERIARACSACRIAPEDVLFLDLETTGLSTTPVFLIGTMECTGCGFHFKQYFARDYSEEASILAAFSERLKGAKMIITFNGKSFDVPFLQNRAAATGVQLARVKSHLDLLHEARRVYGRRLPNCKLQTLEQLICGRTREEDIPGCEIPAAYHEFVRTGNANKIRAILLHNLYDLLTMADLMHCMWRRD